MDWKDTLQQLARTMPPDAEQTAPVSVKEKKKPQLTLFYEKRKGKPQTIIVGFDSEEEALEMASMLKKRLACGGSERDQEVLLQGDVRDKLRLILKEKGYKVKN